MFVNSNVFQQLSIWWKMEKSLFCIGIETFPSFKHFTVYSLVLMQARQLWVWVWIHHSVLCLVEKHQAIECVLERMTKWVRFDGAFKKCPGAIPFCLFIVHHQPPCSRLLCDLVVFQLHLPCITSPQHLGGPSPTNQTKKKKKTYALTVSFHLWFALAKKNP